MNAFFLFRFLSQNTPQIEVLPPNNQILTKKIEVLLVSTPESIISSNPDFIIQSNNLIQKSGLLILHYLVNQDPISADKIVSLLPSALIESKSAGNEWMNTYFSLLQVATKRICRTASIEQFESTLEEIEWDQLPEDILQDSLLLTGYLYLQENLQDSRKKCKPWLERLSNAKDANPYQLIAKTFLFEYHLTLPEPSSANQVEKLADAIEAVEAHSAEDKHLLLLMRFRNRIREVNNFPEQAPSFFLKSITDLTDSGKYSDVNKICLFFTLISDIQPLFYRIGASQCSMYAIQLLKLSESIQVISASIEQNPSISNRMKALSIPLLVYSGRHKLAWEKSTELVHYLKAVGCFRPLIQLGDFFVTVWTNVDLIGMAEKYLVQNIQYLLNRKESFEAEPIVYLLKRLNELYLREFSRPGVSPYINSLPAYVELHSRFLILQENFVLETGMSLFRVYQQEFKKVEESTRHNIHAHMAMYGLQLRLLAISCKFNDDTNGYEIARQVLRKIENPLNPLYFLNGKWNDFKEVPSDVRNKIINQSISITKGDLPAAAEHLKFSYRNLRSYIALNEVNRLGNFLNEHSTSSRSLEEGIRLIFHDLYLKGHIFEVVFDMPAFFVRKSGTGFTTKEMEYELEVKPSTAKKYILILLETGMIEHNKSGGTKSSFKISVENIMRRNAEDKSRRIS